MKKKKKCAHHDIRLDLCLNHQEAHLLLLNVVTVKITMCYIFWTPVVNIHTM